MNRRTFIKIAGIGSASLLGNTLLFAKEEQQWIRCSERLPEVENNIIIFLQIRQSKNIINKDFYAGTTQEVQPHEAPLLSKKFGMRTNKDLCKNVLMGRSSQVTKENWCDNGVACNNIVVYDLDKNDYWIPIKDKLPNKLPKLPKYIKI